MISEETRRKMSQSHKGKRFTEQHKMNLSKRAKIVWNLPHMIELRRRIMTGTVLSTETKNKISISKKGKCVGSDNPNWRGGVNIRSKEYARFLYQKNPHTKRFNNIVRFYRYKNAGDISKQKIQMVYEDNIKKYGTLTCIYCLNAIEFGKDSLEHKLPISRGGTNEYENLAVACRSCNCKKGSKTESEFRKEI